MSLVDAAVFSVHMVFAGVWTGSVVFVTWGVLPTAAAGDANADPMAFVTDRLKLVSRTSALLLFLTGGHLAGTLYTVESLTGGPRGRLVLAMLALWFVLAALVEVGAGKLSDGFAEKKVRSPAREARPYFLGASVVAVALLVDAALLVANVRGLLTF